MEKDYRKYLFKSLGVIISDLAQRLYEERQGKILKSWETELIVHYGRKANVLFEDKNISASEIKDFLVERREKYGKGLESKVGADREKAECGVEATEHIAEALNIKLPKETGKGK